MTLMRMTDRLHSTVAAAAVAAGAGLLGSALGGLAAVDSQLRAATDAGALPTRPVVQRTSFDRLPDAVYDDSRDCDRSRPPEV